jgi:hypothetical protein
MRKEKIQVLKTKMKKKQSQQTTRKSREWLVTTLKTYIQINWKIEKEWTNS